MAGSVGAIPLGPMKRGKKYFKIARAFRFAEAVNLVPQYFLSGDFQK